MTMLPFRNMAARAKAFESQCSFRVEQQPIAVAGLAGENSKEATGLVYDGGGCPRGVYWQAVL